MMRPYEVVLPNQGDGGMIAGVVSADFSLSRSFPDPFDGHTSISYSVPFDQHVQLRVYNSLGQEVKTLVNQSVKSGSHRATWDATDNSGARVAAGTYFYKMASKAGIHTQRTTLLK